MKLSSSSVFLFVLTTKIFAADEAEVQAGGGSLFERSNLFFNALCLPVFDGCSARSTVVACSNNKTGDSCSNGDSCIKTKEGGVVCATYINVTATKNCTKSRDCARGEVCIDFGGNCTSSFCVDQVRFG